MLKAYAAFRPALTIPRILGLFVLAVAAAFGAETEIARRTECLTASAAIGSFRGCAVSDLDGDHQADYAISQRISTHGRPGSISVHLSRTQSDAELVVPDGVSAHSFILRDVNGDGDLDVALLGSLDQTVGVFLNRGQGRFEFEKGGLYLTSPCSESHGLSVPYSPEPGISSLWDAGAPNYTSGGLRSAGPPPAIELARGAGRAAAARAHLNLPRSRAP